MDRLSRLIQTVGMQGYRGGDGDGDGGGGYDGGGTTESDFNSPMDSDFGGTDMGSGFDSPSSGNNDNDSDNFQGETTVDWGSMVDDTTPLGSTSTPQSGSGGLSYGDSYGSIESGYSQSYTDPSTGVTSVSGATEAGDSFSATYSEGVFGNQASYSQLSYGDDGSYTSYEGNYNAFADSFNTTTVSPVAGGGYSVSSTVEKSTLGVGTTSTFEGVTASTGSLGKSYESTSISGLTFTSDTHYTTNNQKLGMFAEAGVDLAELVMGEDVSQKTADTAFTVESVLGVAMGLQNLPALAKLATTAAVPTGYRVTAALSVGMKARKAYNTLSDLMSAVEPSSKADNSIANNYGLGGTNGATNSGGNNQYTGGGSSMTSYNESNSNSQSIAKTQGSSTDVVATSGNVSKPSTLGATPQYANIVAISGHTGREDHSWNSMQAFRINYTGDKT